MGGLFTPISAVAFIVVGYLTRASFTTFMTKNLLLVSKTAEPAGDIKVARQMNDYTSMKQHADDNHFD
jgi:hypothetical protein